jgi:ABC-type nitrate/sulfonate/bicarbonate transport system permease component
MATETLSGPAGRRGHRMRGSRGPGGPVPGWRSALVSGALALVGVGLVVAAWQLASTVMRSSQVPSPWQVLLAIPRDWDFVPAVYFFNFERDGLRDALAYTTVNVLIGVAVGVVAGLAVGVFIAQARTARAILEPPLLILGTIPLVTVLPFISIWFGTERFAQSALVIISAFVTTAFAAQSAALTVGELYSNYARTLGAGRTRILATVILPAIGPEVIGAVRLSLAAGWGWQAVAELLGGGDGVGRIIRNTANIGAVDSIFAMLLCITVVALLIDTAVLLLGRFVTRWNS